MTNNIVLDEDGKVRSADDYEILGYWFEVDNVKYFMSNENR